VEGIRFTAQVGAPNIILGLFNKRELPARIASTVGADYLGYRLVEGMVKSYGPGPFYVRVAKDEALLITHPDDLKFVLGGSPDPFASDPEPKRKGMAAFQPDALTISRGEVWADRRRFAEAVLDTGKPMHRLAQSFTDVAREIAGELAHQPMRWQSFNEAFQKMTRRVVFGDRAAGNAHLSDLLGELMSAGNKMPGEPAPGYDELISMIEGYLKDPEPNSLAALIAEAPAPVDVKPAGRALAFRHGRYVGGKHVPCAGDVVNASRAAAGGACRDGRHGHHLSRRDRFVDLPCRVLARSDAALAYDRAVRSRSHPRCPVPQRRGVARG
jgi:hypothetical protein